VLNPATAAARFVEYRDSHTEIRLNRILLATKLPANINRGNAGGARTGREHGRGAACRLRYWRLLRADFGNVSGRRALSAFSDASAGTGAHGLFLARSGRTVTHITEGRPYAEIVRMAAETEADLIVIGTSVHASVFGGAPVLGPEIERVVRNAPCPVLSVPSGKVMTPLPALVRNLCPKC